MKAWKLLRPFRGSEVRRFVAFLMFAVAIPRLPFAPMPPIVYPLGILPQEAFGWLFLAAGAALLVTGNSWRLKLRGRVTALIAFVAWSVLAAATTSATSMLIDLVVMWAMLGEIIIGMHDDEC